MGCRLGAFKNKPPDAARRPLGVLLGDWLGMMSRLLLAHANLRSVSGGQHAEVIVCRLGSVVLLLACQIVRVVPFELQTNERFSSESML